MSTNWDGEEAVRRDPRAQGMLVDRGVFDAALLSRAEAIGVRVLQPSHVRDRDANAGWMASTRGGAG